MANIVPTIGAILVIALMHVIAGIVPIQFTGDTHLALWLVSLLIGLVTFVILQQEMSKTPM